MGKHPLSGLLIRGGVVRKPDLGFILAYDPQMEDDDIPHTVSFTWKPDGLHRGEAKFSAHSCCIIDLPEYGLVKISEPGWYSIVTHKGVTAGNIFDDSSPPPEEPLYAGFRSVSEIAGKAHAVGFRGIVYRLDKIGGWTRIDHGLPNSFDGRAISGFNLDDIYVVGRRGQLWWYDGKKWIKHDLPTNKNLTAVICAGDGNVYIAGHGGLLIRGREDVWEIIDHAETTDDIWDLKWFKKKLYISTLHGVYFLVKDSLELVDFGEEVPSTFYMLSTGDCVMWSIGRQDIMAFDGKKWSRIV